MVGKERKRIVTLHIKRDRNQISERVSKKPKKGDDKSTLREVALPSYYDGSHLHKHKGRNFSYLTE